MQKNTIHTLIILTLFPIIPSKAAPLNFIVGAEQYRETYREYTGESARLMQQKGNLWSLNTHVQYTFDSRHAVKLEGRYAKGKADYTGGRNPGEAFPQGSPYGSLNIRSIPRKTYETKVLYKYTQPLTEKLSLAFETGPGYRVLQDLSGNRHPSAYNRKNHMLYMGVGAELRFTLPHQFELAPKITYNRMLRGKQYSYYSDITVKNKQPKGRGIEMELILSKRLSNHTLISMAPFYRGWEIADSNITNITYADGGRRSFIEPKNHTREAGLKLQYQF